MSLNWPDTKRRLFLYGSRMIRTAVGRGLRDRVLYLHFPKCGGTSTAAGLFSTVPLTARIGVIDAISTRKAAALIHFGSSDQKLCHEDLPNGHRTFDVREAALLTHLFWNTRLVYGHVLLKPEHLRSLRQHLGLVTMMRDPAERALSNYRMAVRARVIPEDFDLWLDSSVGKSMCQAYLRYLSGQNVVPIQEVGEAVRHAIAAVECFDVVGFLDDLPGFQRAFLNRFDVRPPVPRLNVGTGRNVSLTTSQHDRFEALLEPDRRIYGAAECRFRNAGNSLTAAHSDGSYPVPVRHSAY